MSPNRDHHGQSTGTLLSPAEVRRVREAFRQLLKPGAEIEPGLAGVIDDALDHPGSLVRAQLAYGIQRRLGREQAPALELATAIEYFHTASLLFDDLPAMDDARERRGHACPHTVFGEAATMLAALALINRAYELLWRAIGDLPAERRTVAAGLVGSCLGMGGILEGQARDLTFAPGSGGEAVQRVARGKTVTLVRLSLLLPAVVAGASDQEQGKLDAISEAWGLAYQGLDDFKDLCLSHSEAGKSTGRDRALGRPSLPREMGPSAALNFLDEQLCRGKELVESMGSSWGLLRGLQNVLQDERRRLEIALVNLPRVLSVDPDSAPHTASEIPLGRVPFVPSLPGRQAAEHRAPTRG